MKLIDISPYAYCGGDPVNLVDPDGMNWYSYRDYDGVIQYKYVEGQMDSKEMTEGGYTDLGYTYIDTNTNTYYSLFGNILSLITSNNKMPLETAIYQHIDNLLIKSYTDIDNDSNRENF